MRFVVACRFGYLLVSCVSYRDKYTIGKHGGLDNVVLISHMAVYSESIASEQGDFIVADYCGEASTYEPTICS